VAHCPCHAQFPASGQLRERPSFVVSLPARPDPDTELGADGVNQGDLVVVSDVHLAGRPRPAVSRALSELIRAHANCEVVLAGDVFEFSSLPDKSPARAWSLLRQTHPEVFLALAEHVAAGGRLSFVAGNHDAALAALARHIVAQFGAPERVRVLPWFLREGRVHIEHGHLWDRDNAPLHPLADWSTATEPLGVALMRRFVAARGALAFAHAHDTTPLKGIQRAFELFGPRAALLVAQYFGTAIALCVEAGSARRWQARNAERQGLERLSALAAAFSVEAERLGHVLTLRPKPTHLYAHSTFMRLYFDRVFALLLGSWGCWAGLSHALLWPWATAAIAGTYLAFGARGSARYLGPVPALERAAHAIRTELDADVVVFGHTHVAHQSQHYVNLGSFGYAGERGRPYALVRGGRAVELQYWPAQAEQPPALAEAAHVLATAGLQSES
jgi:UDP-2,3-diacylglucosamine pyrophosphatase LpxH